MKSMSFSRGSEQGTLELAILLRALYGHREDVTIKDLPCGLTQVSGPEGFIGKLEGAVAFLGMFCDDSCKQNWALDTFEAACFDNLQKLVRGNQSCMGQGHGSYDEDLFRSRVVF